MRYLNKDFKDNFRIERQVPKFLYVNIIILSLKEIQ